jgi:hypothetical protein
MKLVRQCRYLSFCRERSRGIFRRAGEGPLWEILTLMRRRPFSLAIEREFCAEHRPKLSAGYGSAYGIVSSMMWPIGPYITDFFCLKSRLVIQLDGSQHGEKSERQADQLRTQYLDGEGYRVLRFWNEEVLDNFDGVLEVIARNL